MIGRSIIPIIIDTDNALGSAKNKFFGGDVDDAFALAYLLKSNVPITSIYSVAGNASSLACHVNNLKLCKIMGSEVPCLVGDTAFEVPLSGSDYLALGPLTNLARFIKLGYVPARVVMTLGRTNTLGKWPPFWPMEFNLTKNLPAFQSVLAGDFVKVIVPLDVAYQLKLFRLFKNEMQNSILGKHLWNQSQRWMWRNLLLKGRFSFPVWDLVSAMYLANPEIFQVETGIGYLFENGLFLCDINNKKSTYHQRSLAIFSAQIEIVTKINVELMWRLFFKALKNP